jgi:acetyl esterase/lipase
MNKVIHHIKLRQLATFALAVGSLLGAAGAQPVPVNQKQKAPPSRPAVYEADPSIEAHLDVVYATRGDRALRCDVFRPNTKHTLPAIVVVHGGGWLNGDKTKFRPLAQALAKNGYVTVAIEYRLGGEAKFPAAINDCFSAVRFLRTTADKWNLDPQQIGAVGGSAGGHLVALMASGANVKALHADSETGDASLAFAVVMAGPCELATGSVAERSRTDPEESNSNKWLGKTIDEAPDLYHLASPITHVNKATCPVFFLVGEFDNPARNMAFRQKLADRKIVTGLRIYADGKHGCWNRHPWFDDIVDDVDTLADLIWQDGGRISLHVSSRRFSAGEAAIQEFADRIEVQLTTKPADGKLKIPAYYNPLVRAHWKGTTQEVGMTPLTDAWELQIGKDAAVGATIEIETVGRPLKVNRIVSDAISGAANATISLPAHRAETFGQLLRYEPQPHKNTVGYWANADDHCEWKFYAESGGTYQVTIWQGCGAGQGGSTVRLSVKDSSLKFTVEDTGHFQNFRKREIGSLTLAGPGVYTLAVTAEHKAKGAVMDVRKIELVPVMADKSR